MQGESVHQNCAKPHRTRATSANRLSLAHRLPACEFRRFFVHTKSCECRRKPCCVLKLELRFMKATQKQPGAGERGNPVPAKARPGKHSGGWAERRDHLKLSLRRARHQSCARTMRYESPPRGAEERGVPRCTQSATCTYPLGLIRIRIVKECRLSCTRVSPSSALPGWNV